MFLAIFAHLFFHRNIKMTYPACKHFLGVWIWILNKSLYYLWGCFPNQDHFVLGPLIKFYSLKFCISCYINSYVFCYYCFWYLYKWCMCHRTNIILMMKRKKDPYRRDFFFFKELSEESFFLIQGSWNEIPFLSVTGILSFEVLWEKVLFWEDLWDSVFQYFPICWPKY